MIQIVFNHSLNDLIVQTDNCHIIIYSITLLKIMVLSGHHSQRLFFFVICAVFSIVWGNEFKSAATRPWLDGVPTPLPFLLKRRVSHDSYVYRFGLPSNDTSLGISVCSCILMSPHDNCEEKSLTRPYTPISANDQLGWFELLIKHYDKGAMGAQLKKLKKGDCMSFRQVSQILTL